MDIRPLPELDAPFLDWALWYGANHWPILPCHGKRPIPHNGFYEATTDESRIISWYRQWPDANIGIAMGHGMWALDVDPRSGGDSTLAALEAQHGHLPETLRSLSGRGDGGGHIFFLEPPGGVKNKADLGEGLDVMGQGSYVVAVPSRHPDTNGRYMWEFGPDEVSLVRAPPWLEALVAADAPHTRAPARLQPGAAIPQGTREKTLVSVAGSMRAHGATAEEIAAALEVMNQRCAPPLPPADLFRIARSTSRYPPAPQLLIGQGARAVPAAPLMPQEPWRQWLLTKKNGDPTQCIANFALLLRHHPFWHQPEQQLWWDSVRGKPMMGLQGIDDDTITTIGEWMGTVEKLQVTQLKLLEKCVLKQCRTTHKDLLHTWLQDLPPWDGVERLDTWLAQITDVENTVYSRGVARLLPLSMVARVMEPGCLYRYVVIFEGPEESGKSRLVRAIAGEDWYVELSIGLESKEAHMMLQGAWVAEMAELDSLSRTEETRLKAFITLRNDSYIPKFSNFRESIPRRCIFIGTTNEESYLKGQSGNTRFLPLRLGKSINVELFTAMRGQVFAEALVAYERDKEDWWRLPRAFLHTAVHERNNRRIVNVYQEPLAAWLAEGRFHTTVYHENQPVRFVEGETSWPEIARWFLQIESPERWKDRSLQMQIASALRALGWKVKRTRRGTSLMNVWRYDPTEEKDDQSDEEIPF